MHHFIIIREFKLELQSGSGKVGLWPLWPWPLTSDLWPFAWTSLLSLVITPENFMIIRWLEHSQKGVTDGLTDGWTDGQTDRQTENTICRAAWSQQKIIGHLFYIASSFEHHLKPLGEFKLELLSGNAQFGLKSVIFCPVWPWNLIDDLEKQ